MCEGENGRLRLEFRGDRVTTDAGLLAVRELDEALGFTKMVVVMIVMEGQGGTPNTRYGAWPEDKGVRRVNRGVQAYKVLDITYARAPRLYIKGSFFLEGIERNTEW